MGDHRTGSTPVLGTTNIKNIKGFQLKRLESFFVYGAALLTALFFMRLQLHLATSFIYDNLLADFYTNLSDRDRLFLRNQYNPISVQALARMVKGLRHKTTSVLS